MSNKELAQKLADDADVVEHKARFALKQAEKALASESPDRGELSARLQMIEQHVEQFHAKIDAVKELWIKSKDPSKEEELKHLSKN